MLRIEKIMKPWLILLNVGVVGKNKSEASCLPEINSAYVTNREEITEKTTILPTTSLGKFRRRMPTRAAESSATPR